MFPVSLASSLAILLIVVGQQPAAEAWWFYADPVAPKTAEAKFDLDGVKGSIKFTQKGANESTLVEYDLHGLKGNNRLYHVHVSPVPEFNVEAVRNNATAIAALCGNPATGGHLNPHKITAKLPPKSAPFDKYEIGDLSGKHGPLVSMTGHAGHEGHSDHYKGSFSDDKLPMSGEHSIIGRSIVIHKNDGSRWVCATIKGIK